MNNSILVVKISPSTISAVQVLMGDKPEVQDGIEMQWKPELLEKAFTVIQEKFPDSKMRILLDDSLSNAAELSIPNDLTSEEERHHVLNEIQGILGVPITAHEWDYQELSLLKTTKKILAFSPSQEFLMTLNPIVSSLKLQIETIEPEKISKARHKDPIIGIALKQLSSVDNTSDNPASLEDEDNLSTFTPPKEPKAISPQVKKVGIIIGVIIFVLVIGYGIISSNKATSNIPEPSPSPSPSTQVIISSPSPEPVIDLEDYSLSILNGAGIAGEASLVQEDLEALGFKDIDTGNADNYDFTDTIISYKKDTPKQALNSIEEALEDQYTVILDEDFLANSNDYDVLVTIGIQK